LGQHALEWPLKKATIDVRVIPSGGEGSQKWSDSPNPRFFALLRMTRKIVFQQPLETRPLLSCRENGNPDISPGSGFPLEFTPYFSSSGGSLAELGQAACGGVTGRE